MSEQPTFKSLEHEGWSERAAGYDDYTARITNFGIAPLLDAADIGLGQRVLDVCCGTGLVAAAAVERGASVVGIDISEDMVAIAAAKSITAVFGVGDAEALAFDDASFDGVICNFGLYHLPDPDRAIAEAARVLRPGGRLHHLVRTRRLTPLPHHSRGNRATRHDGCRPAAGAPRLPPRRPAGKYRLDAGGRLRRYCFR